MVREAMFPFFMDINTQAGFQKAFLAIIIV